MLAGLPVKKICSRRGKPGACVLRQHEEQARCCADCGGPIAVRPILDGNYALLEDLGEGSYGTVHQALDLTEERVLALKVLRDLSPEDQRRFIEEAKVTRRLRHPSIVEVYHCRRAVTGHLYIVMEHLEGETVQQALARGAMSWGRARPLLLQLLSGMAMAHAKPVLHRDLKPSNLFLCKGKDGHESLKVLDFGVAKTQDGEAVTRASGVVGTPKYLAPDQILPGAKPNPGRDVYAIGLILIEMLGERPPTLEARFRDPRRPLAHDCPGLPALLPPQIFAVLERTLAVDPQQRFSDAGAVLAALELAEQVPVSVPLGRSQAALLGGGVLALAVVLLLVALAPGREPEQRAVRDMAVVRDMAGVAARIEVADMATPSMPVTLDLSTNAGKSRSVNKPQSGTPKKMTPPSGAVSHPEEPAEAKATTRRKPDDSEAAAKALKARHDDIIEALLAK